jgi:hypothetical protein
MRAGALPYGPNTVAIRRFLQHLAARSAEECAAAARQFAATQRSAAFTAADRALEQAVSSTGREQERDALVGPLVQLLSGHPDRLAADPSGAHRGMDLEAMSEAALAATLALLVRDVLRPDDFATLYAPFAELIPVVRLGP